MKLYCPIISFCSLLLLLSFSSCDDDDMTEDPIEDLGQFIGDYSIESTQTVGLLIFTDQDGNVIGQGEVTETFSDDLLRITRQGLTDTLLIDGLMRDFETHQRQTVQAVVENDSLTIIYEPGALDITKNDYIRGKIWVSAQAIFLEYRWDRSDIADDDQWWGEVMGQGMRIP